jgi:transketolase
LDVYSCDGHDPVEIDRALTAAKTSPGSAMIACKTQIALGHSAQDTRKGHGALTDPAQMKAAKEAYGWTAAPFEITKDIKAWWESLAARGAKADADWQQRLDALPMAKKAVFKRVFAGTPPAKLSAAIRAAKKLAVMDMPKLATRSASEKVLVAVNPIMPKTIGGSADRRS